MKCNYCDEIHIGFVEVFQNRFIYFCDEHKNNIEKMPSEYPGLSGWIYKETEFVKQRPTSKE